MEKIWVVRYQVPEIRGRYREVAISFRSEEAARQFFEQNLSKKAWFDPTVCYVEGPVEVR